jgi:hypothetical protein
MKLPRTVRHSAVALTSAALVGAGVLAAAPSATAPPSAPTPVACSGCWHPALRTSWNWVLSVAPTAPYRAVQMYDVDGFDNSAANVAALHAAEIKAVCYLSAGTYENWRPDASRFPSSLLGNNNGWPGRSGWTSASCSSRTASCARSRTHV